LRVEIHAPVNRKLFDERVELEAREDAVRVSARSSLPLQMFDWARNRRNVERVERSLCWVGKDHLRQPVAGRKVAG
jgi:hypothetical protein